MKRDTALRIVKITRHQYYYKPKPNRKRGRKPSSHTLHREEWVSNAVVSAQIKDRNRDADLRCGYHRMTAYLKLLGYEINDSKVYRLMKESGQLLIKIRPPKNKNYVKYRIVTPLRPLEVLEMDIKVIWLAQYRRNAYILTVIDTFTRAALDWQVGYNMTQRQVRKTWERIIRDYLQPNDLLKRELHLEIRNDNGPQFCATKLRNFFEDNHLDQVFTHPYTPQENGHVESFHKILSDALQGQSFWSLQDLEERLVQFYHNYNYIRLHGSAAKLPPMVFWECWEENLIERIELPKKKVRFKLKVPYQELSGNECLREVLRFGGYADNNINLNHKSIKKVSGPDTSVLTTIGAKITIGRPSLIQIK